MSPDIDGDTDVDRHAYDETIRAHLRDLLYDEADVEDVKPMIDPDGNFAGWFVVRRTP